MEERIKATKEQADKLEFINAEIKRLEDKSGSDFEIFKLMQEKEQLQSDYDWHDEVFEENGKKGLKNILGEIVVPAIYDGFGMLEPYYYKSTPVMAKQGEYVGLVQRDGKGTPITKFEYHLILPIFMTPFYAVWKKEDKQHFALMVGGEVFTPYEIQEHYMPCDGVLPLEADGKQGMLAYELGLIYIKPEYDEIYDEGVGSDFVFVKDGVKGRVTLDKRFISDEEYKNLSAEEQDELDEIGFICAPDW